MTNKQENAQTIDEKMPNNNLAAIQSGVTVISKSKHVEVEQQKEKIKKVRRKRMVNVKKEKKTSKRTNKKNKLTNKKRALKRVNFNIPKISLDLSGLKLPKGITWAGIGLWSIAMTSIIVLAVR